MTSSLLFVNGTLMRGLALHANLDGAEFVEEARTAPVYRIYSIGDVHPGMFEVAEGGVSVPGEIYRLPDEVWRRVEAGEPPGLYRGPVRLSDGRTVPGILFPAKWPKATIGTSPAMVAGERIGRRARPTRRHPASAEGPETNREGEGRCPTSIPATRASCSCVAAW